MLLSRGARRCFALLQSYAARSGVAFPFQKTLAVKLEVDPRTVQRYVHELRAAGAISVKQRQHSSNEYVIQTRQNVGSGVGSGVGSEASHPYMSKTLSGGYPLKKGMGTEYTPRPTFASNPQADPKGDAILEWAQANGYPMETGADLMRVLEAMEAA